MDRQDMYLGMNRVSTQYIEEAEIITCLKSKKRYFGFFGYLLGILLIIVFFYWIVLRQGLPYASLLDYGVSVLWRLNL